MRIEWLSPGKQDRVILFFNGWGMDKTAVAHLQTTADVLMFYDYRCFEDLRLPDLSGYGEIYVAAWSMGVWAAARILPQLNIRPAMCVAFNGTERPIDDRYGIPERIYALTEKGMDEKGRRKFITRMLNGEEETQRFMLREPCRDLNEVREELACIRKASREALHSWVWDKVFISAHDLIFPVVNQENWWKDRSKITTLPGGHYPFYAFQNWNEIFE